MIQSVCVDMCTLFFCFRYNGDTLCQFFAWCYSIVTYLVVIISIIYLWLCLGIWGKKV